MFQQPSEEDGEVELALVEVDVVEDVSAVEALLRHEHAEVHVEEGRGAQPQVVRSDPLHRLRGEEVQTHGLGVSVLELDGPHALRHQPVGVDLDGGERS